MSSSLPGIRPRSTAEFLESFDAGKLLWPSLREFPTQEPGDRDAGDRVVQEAGDFVESVLDPEVVDGTRRLPDGFLAGLQERGYLRLRADPEIGGLGLSSYNAFRVIERVSAWSVPAGQVLGIQAGVGAGAMLPAIPAGELRDFVRRRIAEGTVSGFADTDESGQNNAFPSMTATLTEDGSSYLLRGRKLFTGHGTVADLLGVSATVVADGRRRVGAFFVDTRDAAGFRVASSLDYLGSRGLPNGALVLDDVRVPREHALLDPTGDQLPPLVGLMALTGRTYFTGAPALAIARNCLAWTRDFVARRSVDGRELGSYDSVQRIVATTLADVFAMDSAVRWTLSGPGPQDQLFERFVAKNILTTTCWRVVDRTMSLLAAEGFETTASKARRGAPAIPLDRAFRDARGLRIAGNIDFRLDEQAGRLLLNRHYAGKAEQPAPGGGASAGDPELSPANQEHLRHADQQLAELGRLCASLIRTYPAQEELFAQQRTVLLIGRIATEIFTMCAVLSRASRTAGTAESEGQELADIHCTAALHRVSSHWRELHTPVEPDFAKVSGSWLAGTTSDDLIRN
ncbi:acyl-CoA dehydrogenase family protein [Streptomyces sp. NPDC056452]|uniref:acyl-CoA dehydrogenase family protein n=1 Tax=Streptomyces sp. NPDC056452 TaxID=3345821 RepID=UPI0036C0C3E6